MNLPKISVIVPVYSAETFLNRCLDSILNQVFKDWEVLLIDDGSPDNSGSVCDEYARMDTRIKVFHKANGGVGSARNLGLDNAKGEWITFLDADDMLDENFMGACNENNNDSQLIVCNALEFWEEGQFCQYEAIPEGIYTGDRLSVFFEQYLIYNVIKSPWGKFFRKEIIEDLRFPIDQNIGEDTVFVLKYLQKIQSIKVSCTGLYLFRRSQISSEQKYSLPVNLSAKFMRRIFTEYRKLNVRSSVFETVEYEFFFSLSRKDCEGHIGNWYSNPDVWDVWQTLKKYSAFRERLVVWLYHQYNRITVFLRFIAN